MLVAMGKVLGTIKQQTNQVSFDGKQFKEISSVLSNRSFSVPRGDRGLLTTKKDFGPSPTKYNGLTGYSHILKNEGSFAMPKSSRITCFSKCKLYQYDILDTNLNHAMISKGLY